MILRAASRAARTSSSVGAGRSGAFQAWASEGLEMTQRTDHSSSASISAAPTRRISDSREGNPCTTLARRLISRLALSWTLLVRILILCDAGNAR